MTNNVFIFLHYIRTDWQWRVPYYQFPEQNSSLSVSIFLYLLPGNNTYHPDDLMYFIRYLFVHLQSIKNINDHKNLFHSLSLLFFPEWVAWLFHSVITILSMFVWVEVLNLRNHFRGQLSKYIYIYLYEKIGAIFVSKMSSLVCIRLLWKFCLHLF